MRRSPIVTLAALVSACGLSASGLSACGFSQGPSFQIGLRRVAVDLAFKDATKALAKVRAARLLVRDGRIYPELPGTLRITIGASAQNTRLLQALA